MIRLQQLKMPVEHSEDELLIKIAKTLHLQKREILSWKIIRQSVDARRKPDLKYIYTVDVKTPKDAAILKKVHDKNIMSSKKLIYQFPEAGEELLQSRPVIVGSGPAGLICAYMLAKYGYRPLVIERGDEAGKRMEKVSRFWQDGSLDPESNVQFGEGGAGTFSDGKLNTSVKDPVGRNQKVLELLVEAGAPAEILYQQKPHLGTDLLIEIVQNLRKQIIDMGGEFQFGCQMTGIEMQNQQLTGIICNHSQHQPVQALVCAVGHSARDTFEMLYDQGLEMSAKSFAVGVRMEHPQKMINRAQYGREVCEELGAASYKLTHQLNNGHGIYTFCMCPGGYVVNASSEPGALAVNGMSYHGRAGENANSAVIVTVAPEDYAAYAQEQIPGALSGIAFQRYLEQAAFRLADGKIPVQRFGDFVKNQSSTTLGRVTPSVKGQWQLANLQQCLPKFLCQSLAEGVTAFNKKIPGFADPDSMISAVESRTSSPVRIHRDDSFEGNIKGFYPCGEGAGYAGGITSAAIDGLKTAEAIRRKYKI